METKGSIFVVYDESGAIRATAASSNSKSTVVAVSGHRVHKMDRPEMGAEALRIHLIDLHKAHRVDLSGEPRIALKARHKDVS